MQTVATRLSYKQRAFLEHYFTNWSATESAKLSGYTAKDLDSAASTILSNSKIQQAIEDRLTALGVKSSETLWRVSDIARGAMRYFIVDGQINVDSDIAKEKYHLLKKLKRSTITRNDRDGNPITTETIEIEVYDALTALTLLMKHHNLLASDATPVNQTNNTLIINNPSQANDAGIDRVAVAQELARLQAQWNVVDVTNDSVTSNVVDSTSDTTTSTDDDSTDDSE